MTNTSSAYSWKEIPHLAQRTLWSLRKPEPDAAGEAWLLGLLTPAETNLYRSMAAVDRAHAINCARAVESFGSEVVVASALHDVGKTQAGLGTSGRVAASLAGLVMYDKARGVEEQAGIARPDRSLPRSQRDRRTRTRNRRVRPSWLSPGHASITYRLLISRSAPTCRPR